MPKLHTNIAVAAVAILESVTREQKRASRALHKAVQQNPKWGARDRRLIQTIVFDCLRWKRLFAYLLHKEESALTSEELLMVWCSRNEYRGEKPLDPTIEKQPEQLAPEIATSFPDWLYERGKQELPEVWELESEALNKQAAISIRVNRLKTSPEKLQKELSKYYNLDTRNSANSPDALELKQGAKLDTTTFFLKGHFEIQDANSQKIASFSEAQPGHNVIDLCAGAGGKSLHLAAMMRNKGEIRAYDVETAKLKELNRRKQRAGVKIIQAEKLPSDEIATLEKNHSWADIVLIDAPCSGIGTLKRNPELKWRLSEEQLQERIEIQQKLLLQARNWVKIGGVLIYATCSILPSENENQIDWFLSQNPEFRLEERQTLFAHQSAFDGFFMARMRKQE